MAKFDLHKTQGIDNVMHAVQQVKSVNNFIPLTEAKSLDIKTLYPSAENFYAVAELDELSESIRAWGILQPLLVSEQPHGTYEIIAGNRRYEAAKMAGLELLPCIVKQQVETNRFKIMLIHANMFRVKTDMERATEVAELKKAITAIKASDKSIKGRTSEIAGQILNLSYRQVNRLDNLNKLIPEIQALVQSEKLTASGAEQFSGLAEAVQKEIYEALIHSGVDINRKEAAQLKESFQDQIQEIKRQSSADISRLSAQISAEQAKLQEKEQALEALTQERLSREATGAPTNPQDKKALEKVKVALVTALQERKEIEDRYNDLSQKMEMSQDTAMKVDTDALVNEVKRRVQLQECIGQLKVAVRIYEEYKSLYCADSPLKRPVVEAGLIKELTRVIDELSSLVTAEINNSSVR